MSVDEYLFRVINGMAGRFSLLDELMLQVSQEGNVIAPLLFLGAYWAWRNWYEARLAIPCLLVLVGVSDLLGGQLKAVIGRLRPCQALEQVYQLVGCGGLNSMPSNHALNSSTALVFLMVFYPSLGWVMVPLLILIGLSRVYLGAHYPTDVLVGTVIGGVLGGGVAYWLKKQMPGAPTPSSSPSSVTK